MRRALTARIRVPIFHTIKVRLDLDLDIDARRQVQAHEHIDGL